jgi:hypothetical protein
VYNFIPTESLKMAPMKIPAVARHPTRQNPKDKEAFEGLDKAHLDLEKMVVQLSFDQGST